MNWVWVNDLTTVSLSKTPQPLLRKLSLAGNKGLASEESMAKLECMADALQLNTNLTELDLSDIFEKNLLTQIVSKTFVLKLEKVVAKVRFS